MHRRFRIYLVILFSGCTLLNVSCLNSELDNKNDIETKLLDPVSPDGTLETVTWNLKWYGSTHNGPHDEELQTDNILKVIDSLKADLYALQEIHGTEALNQLLERMSGYRGFVAEYMNWPQKTAFLYNTAVIDSVSAGAIRTGQNEYDWASGRFPLYFRFNYTFENTTLPLYAIVIHGKANTGSHEEKQESYERRKRAAESLYAYLQKHEPDSYIILLGDFNDDVDVSIYDNKSPSSYHAFTASKDSFRAVTQSISQEKQSSYIAGNYTDLIDHIIISSELFPVYSPSSEAIFWDALDIVKRYEATTSDHLPVWAKFDMTNERAKANYER